MIDYDAELGEDEAECLREESKRERDGDRCRECGEIFIPRRFDLESDLCLDCAIIFDAVLHDGTPEEDEELPEGTDLDDRDQT